MAGVIGALGTLVTGKIPTNKFQAQTANLSELGGLQQLAGTGGQAVTSALGQLGGLARGVGPSAGQVALQQGAQAARSGLAGALAGVRGISPGAAARTMANAGATMAQQQAGQGASLRAQEQLGALGQLGGLGQGLLGTAGGLQQAINQARIQNLAQAQQINAGVSAQNAQNQLASQMGLLGSMGQIATLGLAGGGGGATPGAAGPVSAGLTGLGGPINPGQLQFARPWNKGGTVPRLDHCNFNEGGEVDEVPEFSRDNNGYAKGGVPEELSAEAIRALGAQEPEWDIGKTIQEVQAQNTGGGNAMTGAGMDLQSMARVIADRIFRGQAAGDIPVPVPVQQPVRPGYPSPGEAIPPATAQLLRSIPPPQQPPLDLRVRRGYDRGGTVEDALSGMSGWQRGAFYAGENMSRAAQNMAGSPSMALQYVHPIYFPGITLPSGQQLAQGGTAEPPGIPAGVRPPLPAHLAVLEAQPRWSGGAIDYRFGGPVPGHAPVEGDSERNDVVPAWLSPGEGVIPRSKMDDPDEAASFARHLSQKRRR